MHRKGFVIRKIHSEREK